MKTEQTLLREKAVIQSMIEQKLIGRKDFEITDDLISHYCSIYNKLYSLGKGYGKNNNYRYARKLAAISLMDYKKSLNSRSIISIKHNSSKMKCGFVYLISNPAFPNCIKIGITQNIDKRLATYQTYDPFRSYKIEHYEFFEDIREKEKLMLNRFSIDLYKGEWIPDDRTTLLKELFSHWSQAN